MGSVALRRKQLRAAEAVASGFTYAEAGSMVGRSERMVTRWLQNPELRALAERDGAPTLSVDPRQVLAAALRATRANGQPDWATRLAAARLTPTLPAQPVDGNTAEQPPASIVVDDLPAGAVPVTVLHRPQAPAAAAASASEPSSQPASTCVQMFSYQPADAEPVSIGSWSPSQQQESAIVTLQFQTTEDHATAERWRSELAAGRLPASSNDTP